MRILLLRNLFYPEDLGGNRYPFEVAVRLGLRGHALTVVSSRPTASHSDLPPGLLRVLHYPTVRNHAALTLLSHASGAAATLARLSPADYDLLLVSWYDVALGALTLPAWRRLPFVYIYHSEFYSAWVEAQRQSTPFGSPRRLLGSAASTFMRWAERRVFGHSRRIVAVSDYSRRQILERAPEAGARVHVIPTGVDAQHFKPVANRAQAKQALGFRPNLPLLVGVGRLTPVKRFDRLLRAQAELTRRGVEAQLALIGDGIEASALRALADRLGILHSVRLTGYQDAVGVAEYMQAADLQVCTSEFENNSLAIIEALACGTPVVGTPTGGTPAILEQVDPRLVCASAEPEAIADVIGSLLEDPAALRALQARSRAVAVQRYDWETIVSALEALLGDVCGAPRQSRAMLGLGQADGGVNP
jgi:glycosyltransferase involved in cell wall biosynthesis